MKQKKDTSPAMEKLKVIWAWVYRLRSVVLAIPVAAAAVILAIRNMANLPQMVSLGLEANGVAVQMVSRGVAVMGPLALTAVCLLMVFCSRKILYPWLISLFSLVLPIFIYITNIFPG